MELNNQKEALMTKKIRENPWILSTIVLTLLIFLLVFINLNPNFNENLISENEASEMMINFYKTQGLENVKIISIEDVDDKYKIQIKYGNENTFVYMTKSGQVFLDSLSDFSGEEFQEQEIQLVNEINLGAPKIDLSLVP